jgi:broad specificity phosphatase PhoE
VILIRHGQTEFNRVFSVTRRDPGIRDPHLTAHGRAQAAAVAAALQPLGVKRLTASPYARALETATIISRQLDLPITIDMLIAERFCFACDIGSPLAELRAGWPDLVFDHLPDPWWPRAEETEEAILERSKRFCRRIATEDWPATALVTHWGFIRALTGLKVPNGAVLRIDPTRHERSAEMLFVAPAEQGASPPLMTLRDPC